MQQDETNKTIEDYSPTKPKGTQRSPAELRFTAKLMSIYEEAFSFRARQAAQWESFRQFVRGRNHWPNRRPSYKVSATLNFVPSNLERKAALLTDTKPKFEVRPRVARLDDTAEILTKCVDAIWEERDVPQKLVELAMHAQTFGSGFTNVLYNRDLDGGRGDIDIAIRDPRSVLIDPTVNRSYNAGRGEYMIFEELMPLAVARDRWPRRADLIKPNPAYATFTPVRRTGFLSQLMSKIWRPSTSNDAIISEVPRVLVREFWLRDRTKGPDGRPRFRNQCRKVTMVNDIIVSDGSNPYWDGRFPGDMLDWHFDMDTAWGWGDVELLKGPQELINKLIATVIENAILMANSIWIGDADALSKKDWTKLTNEPGSHVRVRPGKELRREPPPPLPDYVFRSIDILKSYGIEEVTGMVDVMRGLRTGQVESGVAIESLQLMAQSMIRLKARAIESLLKRVGQKLIARIFQYYTDDRILNLVGQDEAFQQFGFVRSELLKHHSGREEEAFRDYQFMIVPGSSLAMSKMQKVMMATQLYQLGIIDELELLKTMDYPNAEKVAREAQKRRMEMAQAAQQGQVASGKSKANVTSFPFQAGARGGGGMIM